ncbi:TPA: hypothetical protein N0F65_007085 [Lagenidium giganteum]|uniref:Uncharacterized protein n=1 Tax=Lagenidium giganteum TaxID=4803 RepID=A0AAV2YW60_9STRA|nr:TPA: hypothetical protein N0F65_007085 [Lagenidium giganteum]
MSGSDVRGSSIVGEVNAAIERVVQHFEENDVALRLDVLRSLAEQAKLGFETERLRERLRHHPVTKELVACVTTQSTVFERLVKGLYVDDYSCNVDRERNVTMLTTVRYQLAASDAHSKKRRKKTGGASISNEPLIVNYAFSRNYDKDEEQTVVQFRVTAALGAHGEPKELVLFEMASDKEYPRSFYEENCLGGNESDGEEDSDEDAPSPKAAKSQKPSKGRDDEEEDSDKDEVEGDEEDGGDEGSVKDFGEQVTAFNFDDSVLEQIVIWMQVDDEDVDPADVLGAKRRSKGHRN